MDIEHTGYVDKNGKTICEGDTILYQVGSTFEEKAVIKRLDGDFFIEFESGIKHNMVDFWYPPVDQEITLVV